MGNTVDAETLQSLERFNAGKGDSPKPGTNLNHIRVYSHNLCPFAARARYAFSAKAAEFQETNVCLN